MARVKSSVLNRMRHKLDFSELVSPKMVRFEFDYTCVDANQQMGMTVPNSVANSLVKLCVKYNEIDSEQVERDLSRFLVQIRKIALHVFPTEKIIIRKTAPRVDLHKIVGSPAEMFRAWMDMHKVIVEPIGTGELEQKFGEYLERAGIIDVTRLSAAELKLNRVFVKNYIPFDGAQSTERLNRGLYGVIGVYDGNDRRSNRAGKSALLKSISVVLFGDGIGADKDIHSDADRYMVGLDAVIDGELHTIERNRGRDGGTMVHINGIRMSVTQANATLQTRLCFSKEDFAKIAFVRAGELDGIISEGSAKMKADLMRWLGLDYWERLSSFVSKDLVQLERMIDGKKILLDVDNASLHGLETDLDGIPGIESLKASLAVARSQYDVLLMRIAECKTTNKAVVLKKEQDELLIKIAVDDVKVEFDGELYVPKALRLKLDGMIESAKVTKKKLEDGLLAVKTVDKYRNNTHEKFLEMMMCPIVECASLKCPIGERIKEILEISSKKSINDKKLNDTARAKISEVTNRIDKLERVKSKLSNDAIRMMTRVRRVEEIDALLESFDGVVENVDSALEQDAKNVSITIQELESKSASYHILKAKIEELKKTISKRKADFDDALKKSKMLRFMSSAVGKNGIASLQLEHVLSDIEAATNRILSLVDTPQRIAFAFGRELKKLEDVCSKCGISFDAGEKNCLHCGNGRKNKRSDDISVDIYDSNGRVQDFSQDSSGGQALVALALRIALAQYFGFTVLFLDEVCSSLDDENLEMMIKLLKRLTMMGFYQIFVISHREKLRSLFEHTIIISRDTDKGCSRIVNREENDGEN